MSHYTLARTLARPHEQTVADVRARLADHGFSVLSEADLAAALHESVAADLLPHVVLAVCRPAPTLQAIQADPSVAAVAVCNVVVRSLDSFTTVVEAIDPDAMVGLASGRDGKPLRAVAADARSCLRAMLEALGSVDPSSGQ